jgi:hypothetical protein
MYVLNVMIDVLNGIRSFRPYISKNSQNANQNK